MWAFDEILPLSPLLSEQKRNLEIIHRIDCAYIDEEKTSVATLINEEAFLLQYQA